MDLDELRAVQDRERRTDSLQSLRESFYREVGTYIEDLRERRQRVAEESSFDDPEFRRLSDEIEAAEDTVESIYERRVGKLVKAASFAAADMPHEDEGLTEEERALFEDLVASIEASRAQVFEVLAGDGDAADPGTAGSGAPTGADAAGTGDAPPAGDGRDDPPPPPEHDGGVDAAAAMGGPVDADDGGTPDEDAGGERGASDDRGGGEPDPGTDRPPGAGTDPPSDAGNTAPADPTSQPDTGTGSSDSGPGADAADSAVAAPPDGDTAESPAAVADGADAGPTTVDVDRVTVRITHDVGEILGADERAYDLSPSDVVTLPASNAEVLLQKDAAERLE